MCTEGEMLSFLNGQYVAVDGYALLVLATLLDPYFKDEVFSDVIERTNARELLEIKETEVTATQPSQSKESSPKYT